MRYLYMTFALAFLAGCTGQVQMMPRDSGKIYSGTVQGSATGSGTMSITIDGETYTGPIVRTSSGESFGFIQQYGRGGATAFSTVVSSGGTHNVKGILSSPNGRGLRCEFTSDGGGGGGICVDDKSRVYDAVVSR
jgi:hypothetical protein